MRVFRYGALRSRAALYLPVTDHSWGITHGVTLDSVTEAIRHVAAAGARIGAVLVVSPTYYGVCSDIRGIARACHEAGAALIVDEAHGAHFKFHSALPETALEAGADIVVQSTHKVLGSMTQSAMLHIGLGNAEHGNAEQGDAEDGAAKHGDAKSVHGNAGAASPASVPATSLPAPAAAPSPRVSPRDIARALQLLQSSSPSYLLLASLDATVGHISLPSFCSSLARALRLASRLRSSLQSLGLRVLSPGAETDVSSPSHGSGSFAGFDPLRVAVSVREMGMTGYDVDDVLLREHSVVGELPSLHGIMFAVSTGTTDRDVDRVVAAFAAIVRERGVGERVGGGYGEEEDDELGLGYLSLPSSLTSSKTAPLAPLLPPRDAFFSPSEVVPAGQAVGRCSADMLCPYPPGIPVLLPGEVVTAEALGLLERVLSLGGSVSGLPSDSLEEIRVIVRPD
ncbi:hypothetical protein CLOM_g15302 [Closterium sp. NIES-68]|nr:hypothetical protein CLOM_g15302 [Closterium sp. NIES-68]